MVFCVRTFDTSSLISLNFIKVNHFIVTAKNSTSQSSPRAVAQRKQHAGEQHGGGTYSYMYHATNNNNQRGGA